MKEDFMLSVIGLMITSTASGYPHSLIMPKNMSIIF